MDLQGCQAEVVHIGCPPAGRSVLGGESGTVVPVPCQQALLVPLGVPPAPAPATLHATSFPKR